MLKNLAGLGAFALVCVGVLFLLPVPHTNQEALLIDGVLLFDGERFLDERQVLIEEGRIVEVSAAVRVPVGAQRIDGAGMTLLPGLIDSHTHTWGEGLRDAARFGVTTQIDMFTEAGFFAEARDHRASSAPTDQADLFSAGTLVTVAGGHGTQFGLPIPTLDSAAGADAFVAARLAEGSDFIKLVIEDGSAYGHPLPTLDAGRVQAVVVAAHRRDLLVVAHVSTLDGARIAVEAGVDGLAHVFHDAVIDDALLSELVERELFVIPTLAVIAAWSESTESATDLRGAASRSLYQRDAGRPNGALERAIESIRRLHEAGVAILAGTDAPNPGTAYGASLHDELQLLLRAGLAPSEVLAAATSLPAARFPLGARGRVRAGMRADLLLVDGDLREDLAATTRIVSVFKNGRAIEAGAAAPGPEAPKVEAGTISDFELGGAEVSTGFGWQATTDQMAGGHSSVSFEPARESDNGFVRISARVEAGFPFPWSGLIYLPGAQPMAPVDATGIEAVSFRARGDDGTYRLLFFVEGQMMPITREFELGHQWRKVSIGLDAIADPSRLTAVAWVAGPDHGDYRFDLDDVRWEAER